MKTKCLQLIYLFLCSFLLCCVLSSVAWAQDSSQAETAASTPWWQIVTGILAIPAAIFGVPSAYWLSQKARLETRKLQIEILEKEGKSVS
ncbi:MAG: hypothetical protein AAGC93_19665, partial [Cyanobacteria bacterium P01_F01_bin.53]